MEPGLLGVCLRTLIRKGIGRYFAGSLPFSGRKGSGFQLYDRGGQNQKPIINSVLSLAVERRSKKKP